MPVKISVIVPVFNMERYIGLCLDSILAQSLEGIEVICIDDGSTDGTYHVLKQYAKRYSNVLAFRQERRGAGAARNLGLRKARGSFVAFMDADDYYAADDALERLWKGAVRNGVLAAGGTILRECMGEAHINNNPLRYGDAFESCGILPYREFQYCYGFHRFIYDRTMLKENGICFPTYVRNEDPIFMAMALDKADKLWADPYQVYVLRTLKKEVSYHGRKVLLDIVKGFRDLICFSYEKQYGKLQKNTIKELEKWKNLLFIHIIKGDRELLRILEEMNRHILNTKQKQQEGYFLNKSLAEIEGYVSALENETLPYVETIEKFQKAIIYGAGMFGQSAYGFIRSMGIEFMGFAVSPGRPCGYAVDSHPVRCIDEYAIMKEEALVIIAANERNNIEMKKNAEEKGFLHLLQIKENLDMPNIKYYKLTEEEFAV